MERKHLSIEIPESLWAGMKVEAIKQNRSLTAMVTEVMTNYIEKEETLRQIGQEMNALCENTEACEVG